MFALCRVKLQSDNGSKGPMKMVLSYYGITPSENVIKTWIKFGYPLMVCIPLMVWFKLSTTKPQHCDLPSFHCARPTVTYFDPLVTNGLTHPYQLDESIFILRGVRSIFTFVFHFSIKMKKTNKNKIAPDGTPRFAASHLGLFCLPMSYKKDARLI